LAQKLTKIVASLWGLSAGALILCSAGCIVMNGWDKLDGFLGDVKPALRRPRIVTLPAPVEGVYLAALLMGKAVSPVI
jgi:hypothetical protein